MSKTVDGFSLVSGFLGCIHPEWENFSDKVKDLRTFKGQTK